MCLPISLSMREQQCGTSIEIYKVFTHCELDLHTSVSDAQGALTGFTVLSMDI